MKASVENIPQTYQNVMEVLVQEELEKQLKNCPETLVEYINKVEVATYALNRLPPLYASCEKGKNMQKVLGQKQYREEVKKTVRQALAAIQRDPLRVSIPLISEINEESHAANNALKNLQSLLEEQNLLDYQELSWDNLVSIIQHALNKSAWTGVSIHPSSQDRQNTHKARSKVSGWDDSCYLR